jgi:hypothetical protein
MLPLQAFTRWLFSARFGSWLLVLIPCWGLVSCNPLEGLLGESQKWRELAQMQAQAAIRAVPGERYLQLIDDLNSGDPARVGKAQQFLSQLGHFDPTKVNWEATVSFGFNEAVPLHADSFFAFSSSRAQVDFFLKNAFNPASVTSAIPLPQTQGQLDSDVNSTVDLIVTDLGGAPKQFSTGMLQGSLFWPDSITPVIPQEAYRNYDVAKVTTLAQQRQQNVASRLKSLFRAQYANKSLPVGGTIITIPFYPTEAKNMLFILIPEDDWNKHKNDPNLSVKAVLHKAGDISSTYDQTNPINIDKAQFESHDPVDRPYGLGKVRWAVVDPTHSSISIPDLAPEKIASMEKLLAELNKLNK